MAQGDIWTLECDASMYAVLQVKPLVSRSGYVGDDGTLVCNLKLKNHFKLWRDMGSI